MIRGHPSEAGLEGGKDYRLVREGIAVPQSKVGSFEIKGGRDKIEYHKWFVE